MPPVVSDQVCQAVFGRSIFTTRTDATSQVVIPPLIRIVAALRTVSYDESADEMDELWNMSTRSARQSILHVITKNNRGFRYSVLAGSM